MKIQVTAELSEKYWALTILGARPDPIFSQAKCQEKNANDHKAISEMAIDAVVCITNCAAREIEVGEIVF